MTSLDDTLTGLCHWGMPILHQHDDGKWSCRVKMGVNVAGATFEVSSDYNSHVTPQSAAELCLNRVLKAVNAFEIKGVSK